jgi:hypothetical protein
MPRGLRSAKSQGEKTLRRRVRQRIDDGLLPGREPESLDAGYGTGSLCAACDQPITSDQVEYEVRGGEGGRLRFHLGCHSVWTSECHAWAANHH